MRFNVTFETVTPESAEQGDAADRGFIAEGVTLREAIREHCQGFGWNGYVEADSWPCSLSCPPRWFTFYGEMDYRTGETESRSLHLPEGISPSSALRIARLLGANYLIA